MKKKTFFYSSSVEHCRSLLLSVMCIISSLDYVGSCIDFQLYMLLKRYAAVFCRHIIGLRCSESYWMLSVKLTCWYSLLPVLICGNHETFITTSSLRTAPVPRPVLSCCVYNLLLTAASSVREPVVRRPNTMFSCEPASSVTVYTKATGSTYSLSEKRNLYCPYGR